jgi:hypothetical protein
VLSHSYRIRLEEICEKIAKHEEVSLEEMIWAEKLSKVNQTAAKFLRQARRKAENPEMTEDSLDGFLNALDIGSLGHERRGIRGFDSPDEIAEWFSRDRDGDDEENRRRRD